MARRLTVGLVLIGLCVGFLVAVDGQDAGAARQTGLGHPIEAMESELSANGSVMVSVSFVDSDAMHSALERLAADPVDTGAVDGAHMMAGPGIEVVAVLEAANAAEMIVSESAALRTLASDPSVTSMVVPPALGRFAQAGIGALRGAQLATATEAALMHDSGYSGAGVVIALVDTGIDADHPDLSTSIAYERCIQVFASVACENGTTEDVGPGAAFDRNGHGTDLASLMVSDGTITPLGVAPEASLEVFRISDRIAVDLRDALVSLNVLLVERLEVNIVVMSFGSNGVFSSTCERDLWPSFYDTVAALRARGVFVTASAGNASQTTSQSFPACLADVHSVTGLNVLGTGLATTANIAPTTDLAAPSSGLVVHDNSNLVSGTSQANAVVAGCAALAFQSGQTNADAIGEWLAHQSDRVGRGASSVPALQCAPGCLGLSITVNLAVGDLPTDADDVIAGTAGADRIMAGGGNDVVCGFGGDDVIFGGDGADRIDGGNGADRLFGNFGDDELIGGPGPDTLHGVAGDDVLHGQGGDDRLFGYAGDDWLSGGQGDDRLHGNAGDDTLAGDSGGDRLFGYTQDDALDGGIGEDICRGNQGLDVVARCEQAVA